MEIPVSTFVLTCFMAPLIMPLSPRHAADTALSRYFDTLLFIVLYILSSTFTISLLYGAIFFAMMIYDVRLPIFSSSLLHHAISFSLLRCAATYA